MTNSTRTQAVIRRISFDQPGKMAIHMADGRVLIVPLRLYPELSRMKPERRKLCTIVDDRTILFRDSENVYHLEDFLGPEEAWKQR